jgi:hypothetical protein
MDASGRWRSFATRAATKTEARRLAFEMERQFERQRLGMEPPAIAADLRTVDDLVEWWIETFLRHAPSYATTVQTIRKHIVGSSLGSTSLDQISAGKIDLFLTKKERELKPASVNHLRGYLGRAFNLGRRMERFPRPNPVVDVPEAEGAEGPARLPSAARGPPTARVASPQVAGPLRDRHLHGHAEGRALRAPQEGRGSRLGHDHGLPVA